MRRKRNASYFVVAVTMKVALEGRRSSPDAATDVMVFFSCLVVGQETLSSKIADLEAELCSQKERAGKESAQLLEEAESAKQQLQECRLFLRSCRVPLELPRRRFDGTA